MTPRRSLLCHNCGAAALPIDPGWTLAEVATMLRINRRYVLTLAQQHAHLLDEPEYRPLGGGSHRMYRVWHSHDVQVLNGLLLRTRVKNAQSGRYEYVRRTHATPLATAVR